MGVSVLSNSKPLRDWPAVRRLVVVVQRMAAPALVTVSVQPAGLITAVGAAERKPAPGTQANQKVPMVVVPMLLRVKSYW